MENTALRIAFIDTKLNLVSGGGSNQSLHLLASKLVSFGHKVTLITLSPSQNAYPEDLPYPVIDEGPISSRLDRGYGIALSRILHKHEDEADIFHLWDPRYLLDVAIYRRLRGKTPVVTYLNNYPFCTRVDLLNSECYKKCGIIRQMQHRPESLAKKAIMLPFRVFEHYLEKVMLSNIDAFIAISPAVADIFSYQNVDRRKISVIPPAIDYEHLHSLQQKGGTQTPQNERYNILYVGRLAPAKGVDLLISAISELQFPLWLHIVGDGPQKEYLEQYSRQLGLSDRVVFHGWLPYEKVVNSYLNSQLFVHPARWPEPLGRTVLDAMAFELPVIVADSGGPPWALGDAGLIFRTGDSHDLAEKIRQIQGNPSLGSILATKARKRVAEFDYRKAIPQLLDVYTGIIETAQT